MQEQILTLQGTVQIGKWKQRTSSMSENEIIRSAQNGNLQAFELLVKEYQTRVVSIAFKIVGSPEDAKDVAQEVFIRLYRFLPRFKKEKQFFSWLYRIVINASYDFLKRGNRYRTVPLEDISDIKRSTVHHSSGRESELQEIIGELIETLSSPQKTAFILREVEGFSCREISKIMDCPGGTVRSHLHFARKRLKDLVEKHYPEFVEGLNHEM